MWGAMFIFLGLALATLCIISAFKNLLLHYKLDGSLKSAAVIVLLIGMIFCSLFIVSDGLELNIIKNQLKNEVNLTKENIQLLKAMIPVRMRSAWISSLIGYSMYVLHLYIFKKLQKKIDEEIEKNSHNIWRF